MNTRAITLIATIAVIGIVAVGAGYAYTALTVNDQNTTTAHYITLTQTQTPDSYKFAANYTEVFDTITASDQTTAAFKINSGVAYTGVTGYTFFKIGSAVLHIAPTGYATNAVSPNVVLTIDSTSGFTNGSVLKYFLVDGSNVIQAHYDATSSTWKDGVDANTAFTMDVDKAGESSAAAAYSDVTLWLCYGYDDDDLSTIHTSYPGYTTESPTTLSNGVVVFKATATDI